MHTFADRLQHQCEALRQVRDACAVLDAYGVHVMLEYEGGGRCRLDWYPQNILKSRESCSFHLATVVPSDLRDFLHAAGVDRGVMLEAPVDEAAKP